MIRVRDKGGVRDKRGVRVRDKGGVRVRDKGGVRDMGLATPLGHPIEGSYDELEPIFQTLFSVTIKSHYLRK